MTILQIDRSKAFDHARFGGKVERVGRCYIQRQHMLLEDKKSLALSEVDLSKVTLETLLLGDERKIFREEREKRLRHLQDRGGILLDLMVLQTLWDNPFLFPEPWKDKVEDKSKKVFFDGSILSHPTEASPVGMPPSFVNDPCVLCLCWDMVWTKGGGIAYSSSLASYEVWDASMLSAVLWA